MDPNRTESEKTGAEGNHEANSSPASDSTDNHSSPAKLLNLPPELDNHPQYRVIKRIGRGGMGVLYLVEHRVTARKEALKIIHPHLLNEPGVKERFLREIQTAAKLNHPNVVQTLSAISEGNLLGLVMEYAPGETLQKLVARLGPIAPERALDFMAQAAEGLNHAHELGMVHRDIKPANLMITRLSDRLRVRILDFGLAKSSFESNDQKQMTQADNILGTPEYIAPEQALSPSKADIRADIYSLGCCLYFALTGKPPFVGETTLAVLHAHLIGDYKPILEVRPDLPNPIVRLQQAMMGKSVEQRIQSPHDLLVAIKKVARAMANIDSPPAGVEATIDEDELFQQLASPKTAPIKKNSLRSKSNRPPTPSVDIATTAIAPARRASAGVTLAGRNISMPIFLTILCIVPLLIAGGVFAWSKLSSGPVVEPMATVTVDELPADVDIHINGAKAIFKKSPSGAGWVSLVKPGTTVISIQRDGKELKRQQTRLSSQQVFPLQSNFESILKALDESKEPSKTPDQADSPPPESSPPSPSIPPTPEP